MQCIVRRTSDEKVLPYRDEAEFYDNDNGFVKVAEYCNGELRTLKNTIEWE